MTFTRKHYEETARIIRERARHNAIDPVWREGWHAAVSSMRVQLSAMFAADNPRFDAERFAKACEPGSAK